MPTRVYDHGVLVETIPDTPEQIAEVTDRAEVREAMDAIDAITNLAGAKEFLKKLCRRLTKKGYLP